MRFRATVKPLLQGRYYARCSGAPQGVAEAYGDTREDALERLRKEIRFQLEYCPCSGVADDFVELEIEEPPAPKGSAWR
jgi:hypothetical protein